MQKATMAEPTELITEPIVTIADALEHSRQRLATAAVASYEAEAFALLEHLTGLSRSALIVARQQPLAPEHIQQWQQWLEQRCQGVPLQYLTGTAYFYGLALQVNPAVLIPRPETESLVALVLAQLRDKPAACVVDVGTGSGAIALALKAEMPSLEVIASDISAAALGCAKANAERLALEVTFVLSDVLESTTLQAYVRRAQLLVANPPYLPCSDAASLPKEVQAEPSSALFAGHDGLALFRRLEAQALTLLSPGAGMWLELDPRNVCDAERHAQAWHNHRVAADLLGRERFLYLQR